MLNDLIKRIRITWGRRYYYLGKLMPIEVPIHTLSWVPNGFSVWPVANTGVRVVENFCTSEEAAWLIDSARNVLQIGEEGGTEELIVNDISRTGLLTLFDQDSDDPAILSLIYRCALLFEVPYTHAECILLARCTINTRPDVMASHAPGLATGQQHTVIIYLNEAPDNAGGETVFAGLNLAISPRVGRAVCWSQSAEDSSSIDKTAHESAPASAEADKWMVQIWFGNHALRGETHGLIAPLQAKEGVPLTGIEDTPAGIWAPQDIDLQAVFGNPDKLKEPV